jgi:hypothetical protein
MPKNNTQKIIKALMYYSISKNYTVAMYSLPRLHRIFDTNDKDIIWNKFKHIPKGRIAIYKYGQNGQNSYPSHTSAYIEFDYRNDIIKSKYSSNSVFADELLKEADFLSNLYEK